MAKGPIDPIGNAVAAIRYRMEDIGREHEDLEREYDDLAVALKALGGSSKPAHRRRAPKKARKARQAKPAKKRAAADGPRFHAVCPTHKALFVKEGDGYKCTLGHMLDEFAIKDPSGRLLEDRWKDGHKAIVAAANRTSYARRNA